MQLRERIPHKLLSSMNHYTVLFLSPFNIRPLFTFRFKPKVFLSLFLTLAAEQIPVLMTAGTGRHDVILL